MSNWRINIGAGPLRYSRALNAPKAKNGKKPGCLGSIITLVVVLVFVYLCCWGGVAWVGAQP
ncbi:hypothetical protein KBX03_07620 [Micromonospora sp. C72]|uniref:hypothetical protein n=1 Tax=Micromonospora sp. C72 TaxID=2824880 RepID=UPI001B37F7DE|nr:hypothetical protein [Micromonospora sp. C72]MBQ1042372.1 hypothetical protein [Micromonospora sp. C72]